MKWQSLAFVDEHNEVAADSGFKSEDAAWRSGLWPDKKDIEAARARGCRVVRVSIEEVEE